MRAESNGSSTAGNGVVGPAICPCSCYGLIGILAVELHSIFKVLCRQSQAAVRIKISLLMNQPAGNLFVARSFDFFPVSPVIVKFCFEIFIAEISGIHFIKPVFQAARLKYRRFHFSVVCFLGYARGKAGYH